MNINGYSALFSSLSGQYNIQDSFANLYNNYRQIKQGSYGHLMKAYVGKVGNQAALKAFRETGGTVDGRGALPDPKTIQKERKTSSPAKKETSSSASTTPMKKKSVWLDRQISYAEKKTSYRSDGSASQTESPAGSSVDSSV